MYPIEWEPTKPDPPNENSPEILITQTTFGEVSNIFKLVIWWTKVVHNVEKKGCQVMIMHTFRLPHMVWVSAELSVVLRKMV